VGWMTKVQFPAGVKIFSPCHHIQTGSGAQSQLGWVWVPGVLSLGIKHPGHEADHSSPSANVKNVRSYTSTCPIHLHGVVLS